MTSSRTARDGGSSARVPTRCPVTISPPSAVELRDERIGDGLGSAACHGPPDRVGEGRQCEAEGGPERAVEAEHRVGRDAREEGPCRVLAEPAAGEAIDRAHGRRAEPDHRQRMAWRPDHRPQELGREGVGVADEGPEEAPPGPAVEAAEPGGGGVDRSLEHGDPAAVERVRGRGIGVDQGHTVPGKVDGPEERRGDGQRDDGRAQVVAKPREGRLGRPGAAADGVGRLVDPDRAPGSGQRDRRGQAVGPRPDDDRVERGGRGGRHDDSWFGRSHSHTDAGATAERVVLARSSVTASTSISRRSRNVKSDTVRSWS